MTSRFGESRVLEECHELVKKLKAKGRLKPMKKQPKMFPRVDTIGEKCQRKQVKIKPLTQSIKDKSYFQIPKVESRFSFTLMKREERRQKFKEESTLPYYGKNTYHSALTSSLPDRVHIDKDPIMIKKPEEIQDVDSEFFATIKHKIPKNKVDVRRYVHIVKSILSVQICTGYFCDEANFIKEKFLDEKSILNNYSKEFQEYFFKLENYMAEKHAESMKLLRLSVIATNETEKKREEVKQLEMELNKIKLSLIELEDVWTNYRIYQDFLFQISPISWRKEHDRHYNQGTKNPFLKTSRGNETVSVDKYDLIVHGKIECLEELMILFLQDFQNINKPILFFTTPDQIKEIFHELELKNLNSLLHLRELQEPEQVMRTGLEITSKYYSKESQNIADKLKVTVVEVDGEMRHKGAIKHRVETLLQDVLRRLLASREILRLQVFIEDVYQTCVGQVEWRMSALEMVQAIENSTERQLMLLDSYSPRVVAEATKQEHQATQLALRKAVEARRKVTDLDLLLQAMKRLLKQICIRPKHKDMFRSQLPQKLKRFVPIQEKEKSDHEKDDYFFTETKTVALSFNSLSKVNLFR